MIENTNVETNGPDINGALAAVDKGLESTAHRNFIPTGEAVDALLDIRARLVGGGALANQGELVGV